MEHEIIHLPKERWKGTTIPIRYKTDKYYDVMVNKRENGFSVEIEKKDFKECLLEVGNMNPIPSN